MDLYPSLSVRSWFMVDKLSLVILSLFWLAAADARALFIYEGPFPFESAPAEIGS